ncbi:MAG: DUF1573 domain-containing protein [Proteobacteria bacterium]|nr:DUF1573 domain-containing protein [Pseudomonadota bacterium]
MAREKNSSRAVMCSMAARGIGGLLRRLLIGVLALVYPFGAGLVPVVADAGRPRIVVESAAHDWGSVTQGTKVTHDFVVKNTGDIELVLQRIVPSCGCTATSASSDRIPAGGQAAIHVEVDTAGFSGAKERMVRLFTNDPDEPYTTLTMKGVIEPDVSVEPARIAFAELSRAGFQQPVTADFTVKVRPGSPVTIGEVTTFSKFISVQSLDNGNKQRTVRVALDPKAPNGEFRDRVVVSLAGAAVTSISVPVVASIRGAIRMNPATLSFGVVEGSEVILKKARLENAGPEELAIQSIETDSDAVKARFEVVKPGKIFDIQVEVDPRKLSKDLRSSVTIKTNSGTEESVTLAVYGILPPKLR